jgi:hypothetical protein
MWDERPWCWVWFHQALSQAECIRRSVVLTVIPISVVRPSAAARARLNANRTYPAQPSIGAAAQPAAVADAAARPQDRSLFEGWKHTTVVPICQGGAAKRHTVGPQSIKAGCRPNAIMLQ